MTAETILTERSPEGTRIGLDADWLGTLVPQDSPDVSNILMRSWRAQGIIMARCIIIEAENYPECWRSLCKPSWGSPRGSWRSWRQSPWGRHSCSCTGSSCCPSRWCSWSRTSPSVTRTPPPRTHIHSSCNECEICSVFVVQPDKFNYD